MESAEINLEAQTVAALGPRRADPTRSPRWASRSGAQMRTWGPCALGRENLGAPWGPHVVANAGHAAN